MQTRELSLDTPAPSIPLDRKSAIQLMDAGLSESAENELAGGYDRCRKNGYVSFHTEVLHANHGSRVRREVIGYLNDSGAFRKSKTYLPDSHCNEYVFTDDFNPEMTPPILCQKRATYNTPLPLCLSPSSSLPPLSSSLSFPISSDWTIKKNRNWVSLCQKNNWTIPVDYFGDSVICRAVFEALDELGLPGDWVLDEHLFQPREVVAAKRAAARDARTTPLSCGNRPGSRSGGLAGRKARKGPGDAYTTNSYRRAIHNACDQAFPAPAPVGKREGESKTAWMKRLTEAQLAELKKWQSDHRWSPNRLRHSRGTEIRKAFGLEEAQVTLGHRNADVTQIYAERDEELAKHVARESG